MEYYKQLYDNKSYILNEMGKSIEMHKLKTYLRKNCE